MNAPQPPKPRKSRRSIVRMSDVAKLAGVSSMTVSRALHRPELLSPETRQRIDAVMKGLHYVPDMVAGSLSSTSSRTIGVVVPTLSYSIFSETIQGISDVLSPLRFQTFVSATGFSMDVEEQVVRAMLGRRPDGMVLTGFTHSDATRRMLAASGTPVFEMWNVSRPAIDTAVGFSNKQAAIDMTRYLVGRGHRRIGYIGGPLEFNDRTQDREAGFLEAMKDAGLRVTAKSIVREPLDYGGGARALTRLLAQRPDVEAIFAGAEMLAIGALSAALDRGIAVPRDLAIAGFDDSELGLLMKPKLTSVKLPRYEVGRLLAQNMLARIGGQTPAPPTIIDAGYSLVIRESA